MSRLKIVGGTKYKKKIDPKHYTSAENLLNIIFSAYDLIWLDAIKYVEEKLNGEETFSDSFIGTTSMNEVSEDLSNFLRERKRMIDQLVEIGSFETERKFIIFPKEDNDIQNGLSIVFKVKFDFDEEKENFSFASDMKLDVGNNAEEKYKYVKDEIIKIIEPIKDIADLSKFVEERREFYQQTETDA